MTRTTAPTVVTERIYIRTRTSAQAITFWVDATMLESGSTLGDYFDGVIGGNSSGWLGTAHASESDYGVLANGTVRTFFGWALRDTNTTFDMIFSQGGGSNGGSVGGFLEWYGNQGGNTTGLRVNGVYLSTPQLPPPGEWFHWAIIFDEVANTAKYYINGALVATSTVAFSYAAGGNLWWGQGTDTAHTFDGKMAHVGVVERALTAAEIGTLANPKF